MDAQRGRFSLPALLKFLLFASLAGGIGWLIFTEQRLQRPDKLFTTSAGTVDMCLSCHKEEKLDPAHDPAVIGCAPCHLGNPLAVEKDRGAPGHGQQSRRPAPCRKDLRRRRLPPQRCP